MPAETQGVGTADSFEPQDESEPIDAAAAADGMASGGIVPGSWLAPSTVHRPANPAGPNPPGPDASGSDASGPDAPGSADAALSAPASWIPPAVPPAPAAPEPPAPVAAPPGSASTPGRASILADLPFDAPDELEGWLVALGGAVGILGFLLPWRSSFLTGIDGYFNSFGLGIGAHLPIFLLLVILTVLAILPNRVAPWVRTGVGGMVVGGILFGLVWLYLEGGGTQLGATLSAAGAVLLIAGGAIAVAPARNRKPPGTA